MLAQLQSGVSYDLVVPSDYMIGIMIQEGLLTELDKDAIPNYTNLGDRFQALPYDPDGAYSVAYQYGTTGLGVNLAVVGDAFTPSWALLFDPALTAQFPGGVSVLNDPRETMGAALKYLGYSLNDTTLDHLNEATQLIADAKAGIATFDSDQYDESLVSGEVAVAHGYSGNMIVSIGEADNPDDFTYVLPEEGATLWIDNMSTSHVRATGQFDEVADALMLDGIQDDVATGAPDQPFRMVHRFVDDDFMTLELYRPGPDGELFRAILIESTRIE